MPTTSVGMAPGSALCLLPSVIMPQQDLLDDLVCRSFIGIDVQFNPVLFGTPANIVIFTFVDKREEISAWTAVGGWQTNVKTVRKHET